MTIEELKLWIVEQAVYLVAHSENSPWGLKDEVKHVIEALDRAENLLNGGSDE